MEATLKFSKLTKELMLKDLEKQFTKCTNFVITQNARVGNNDLNLYRKAMNKISLTHLIVKNTLCKKVVAKMDFKGIDTMIEGGCGITFVPGDVVDASKAILGFAKEHENFVIKGAYIEGQAIGLDQFKKLAAMPSKQVMLGMVVSALNAPIQGFVTVLSGVPRSLVYALNAIKTKKESNK